MTTVAAFQQLYRDTVHRSLGDPMLPSLERVPGAYLLELYPARFDPRVLWQEIKANILVLAAGTSPGGSQWRQHVEQAYADAAYDTLSSREYLVTHQISAYLPDHVLARYESIEADYAAFIADVSYQYFWAKFDEVTSMLLTTTYLLVGYAYVPQVFYDDLAADSNLMAGCVAMLTFARAVYL